MHVNTSRLQSRRKRRRHIRQGFPDVQCTECVVRLTRAEQGEERSRRPEFRNNLASSAVPGA